MEQLFLKALEKASQQYSAEQIADMLDQHQEVIAGLVWAIIVLAIFCAFYGIFNEIRLLRVEKRLKNLN